MTAFDVIVVGLGTMGSQILRHLGEKQVGTVLGLEQFTPGHSRTAVGGDTRLFRHTLPEGPQYHAVISESLAQWHLLNELTGKKIYQQTGCLYIGEGQHPYMQSLIGSAVSTGAEVDLLTRTDMRRYPQHRLADADLVVHDPHGGVLHTAAAVQAAIALGVNSGAQIERHEPVRLITRMASGSFRVTTSRGAYTAGEVVVAGGSWSRKLLSPALRAFTHPRRTTLTWFGISKPALFTPQRFPVFKRVGEGVDIYGAPTMDGASIKVSLAEAHPVDSPDRIDQTLTGDELHRIAAAVKHTLTSVTPEVIRADAFPELYTEDQHPLIGRDPDTGAYLATGFSGKGFKLSAGVGKLVADAITDGTTPALRFADPSRVTARGTTNE